MAEVVIKTVLDLSGSSRKVQQELDKALNATTAHQRRLETIAAQSASRLQQIEARKQAQIDTIRERGTQRAIEHERKLQRETQRSANAIDLMRAGVSKLAGVFALLGGAVVFQRIAGAALDAAINIDKARSTLTALTGSAESANQKLAELRKLAAASPGVTTTFATQLFAQLKAIGGIGDEVINSVIKSLGKLNAVFGDVGPEFARNLVQVFQQGFERSDIKEALGRVPIFEQLLEQAFGTKDPAKLRKLKDAGKLTLETFLSGMNESINQRLPKVTENLGAQFTKIKENILTALVPVGEALAKIILPALKGVEVAINGLFAIVQSDFGGIRKTIEDVSDFIGARFRDAVRFIENNRKAVSDLRVEFVRLSAEVKPLIEALGVVIKDVFSNAFRGALIAARTFVSVLTNLLRNILNGIEFVRSALLRVAEGAALVAGTVGIPGGGTTAATAARALLGPSPRGTGQGLDIGDVVTPADIARSDAAIRAAARTGGGGGGGGGGTGGGGRDRFVNDFGLGETAKLEREIELARIQRARVALVARRQALPEGIGLPTLPLTAAGGPEIAGFPQEELRRLEKAADELERLPHLLSDSERFMRGFAAATISVGDAFDRFGANVAQAFGNVRDLFNSLKRAVLDFFNDLIGSTLQNLVKSTLSGLFGGGGGGGGGLSGLFNNLFRSAGGGGGGISAPPSVSGVGSIASAIPGLGGIFKAASGGGTAAGGGFGGFNLGGLGSSLLGAAPLLGAGIGSALGGQSIFGNILGAVGGGAVGLGLSFGASVFGAGGGLGAASLAALGPIGLIGVPLLVGAVLLGKAAQRRKDEEASGQFLTQALQGIQQLAAGVTSGQVDPGQARGIFDRDILGVFKQQISGLKTKSVRDSRLTNQVRDLERNYTDVVGAAIVARQQSELTAQQNALTHSKLIPEFATGGTTRGGLAILHPGEKVLNLQQQSAIRSIAGSNVFDRAGVPGAQANARFDNGGTFSRGLETPIVIESLNVSLLVGKDDQTRIVVNGGSTAQGRAVTVNNVKVARTNREL